MLQAIKNSSLFVKLVILVSLALCPPILFSHLAESYFISKYGYEEAEKTVTNVARLSAESSTVIEGMRSNRPEARKQMVDFVEMLTHVSNVKFIVLIDMQGIRVYHPESWKIGGHIVGGDEGDSLKGRTYISSARGSAFRCGPSGPSTTSRASSWAQWPWASCPRISRPMFRD